MTTVVSVAQGGTGSNSAALARTALGVPPSAAYDQANTARDQANTARTQANSAYSDANTRLSASGGTLAGDLIITGNLTVSGNSTTLNAEILTIEDADIVLLSNVASTPALNAGIIVNRGTSTNTFLRWDEVTDKWGWSDDGSTTYKFTSALDAYAQANSAYGAANNRVLKAGDTMTGQLNISAGGLLVTGNSNFDSGTLFVDSVNDRIGIGATAPQSRLEVNLISGDSSSLMNANAVNDVTLMRAPFGVNPASVSNGQAKWGLRFVGRNDGTYDNGKSAAVYAVSEETAAGYNRSVGLAFHTSGFDASHTERMRITAVGNVGIGTTAPYSQLHLTGDVTMGSGTNARPALKITNWGYSASYRALLIGSSNTLYTTANTGAVTVCFNYDPSVNGNGAFSGDGREIIFRRGTRFVTPNSGDTAFNLTNLVLYDGNVGIGTDTPSGKLHLYQTSGGTNHLILDTNFGSGNAFALNPFITGVSNGGFSIRDVTNSVDRMVIQYSTGNIGIGTTAPQSKLEVTTSSGQFAHFGATSTASGQFTGITLGYRENNSYYRKAAIVQEQIGDNSARGHLHLLVDTADDTGTVVLGDSKLMIHGTTGKVGIGTTSFNTNGGKLQVADGISFPATQSACSDANTLDDYEEGTWTPELRDAGTVLTQGYSYRSGVYHKIGRMVHIHFGFLLSSLSGTSTNALRVYGLPFTGATTGGYQEPMGYAILGNQPTASHSNSVYFFNMSGTAILEARLLLTGADTVYTSNNIDGDTFMKFSMIYWV